MNQARKNVLEVATEVNAAATRANHVDAYNTELYVRIPGIGMRHVRSVGLDEDCSVVLDLEWLPGDAGKSVSK